MLRVRKSEERGEVDEGWLKSRHSFSFDTYYDRSWMGFRTLRVINEDWVAPGGGFPMHPHRDMEIVTYLVSGSLEHRDSMGNGSVITRGEVQRMSAGTGVMHSEFNPSKAEPSKLLQIWILPEKEGTWPSYEQKRFDDESKRDRLRLVASREGAEGSVKIGQDARIYASVLSPGKALSQDLAPGRHAWLQLISGTVAVDGQTLQPGDAAIYSPERPAERASLSIQATTPAEFLLFDLG